MSVTNSGQFTKGERPSPNTEFKKGGTPWNKGRVHEQIAGSRHPQWKGGKPDCLGCGIKLKGYRAQRCLTCYLKSEEAIAHIRAIGFKKGDKVGHKHPNWKGGRGTERHREMRKSDYKVWRSSVFQRDNYTCQVCEQYGGALHADHIKRWANEEELRYSVDNGRTLCVPCHYYVTFKRKMPVGTRWCNYLMMAGKRG